MAETERPHRSTSINSSNNNTSTTASTTSDLFICFTSRLSSSSSMRLSSKSILSPARSASLTTSLSRRLRNSGSLKSASASGGGNGGVLKSPMFGNNGGRKRSGSGYDNNPEPSSPKVTCIGQVRVKTRKHVKNKMRARSRRKGESSFRRSADQSDGGGCRFDASENRWVHLPVTICESLRAFGSELNCFLPCRSSCANGSNHRDRDGSCGGCCDGGRCCGDGSCCVGRNCCGDRKCCSGGSCYCVGKCCSGGSCCGGGNCCTGGSCGRGGSCCGAVFTRWFVAVEETGGKRREIELVVGGGDEVEQEERRRSRRRHVFEGLDFSELDAMKTEKKEREEAGRISICVPPKNALLLMRCRSDPVKVAALASRVQESQKSQSNEPEEVEDKVVEVEEEDNERRRFEQEREDKKRIEICEKWISGEPIVEREIAEVEPPQASLREEEEKREIEEEEQQEEEEMKVLEDSVVEATEESKVLEDSCEEEMEATFMRKIEDDIKNVLKEEEHTAEMGNSAAAAAAETVEKEERVEEENEGILSVTVKGSEDPDDPDNPEPDPSPEPEKRGSQAEETVEKEKAPYKVLPDCLLLMMCEPKLSMEVSKETWVCSTDFVRWLPERPPAKKPVAGDQPKKRTDSNASSRRRSTDKPMIANQVLLQPPRSSCSYPAAPPAMVAAGAMAAEQKAVGANKAAYEPAMLQRCKSEPRRSAAKLAPEACFWKNRKLEPHPPATLGVGAAGVGF